MTDTSSTLSRHTSFTLTNPVKVRKPDDLEDHPLAELMPDLHNEDWSSFLEGVDRDGRIHNPITLYEGKVLDGRHRVRAAQFCGFPLHSRTFKGTKEEAARFVFSENVVRRHMDGSQRAAALAEFITGHGPGRPGKAVRGAIFTTREAADAAGVSETTQRRAKAVKDATDSGELPPHVLDEVKAGTRSVRDAHGTLKDIRRETEESAADAGPEPGLFDGVPDKPAAAPKPNPKAKAKEDPIGSVTVLSGGDHHSARLVHLPTGAGGGLVTSKIPGGGNYLVNVAEDAVREVLERLAETQGWKTARLSVKARLVWKAHPYE